MTGCKRGARQGMRQLWCCGCAPFKYIKHLNPSLACGCRRTQSFDATRRAISRCCQIKSRSAWHAGFSFRAATKMPLGHGLRRSLPVECRVDVVLLRPRAVGSSFRLGDVNAFVPIVMMRCCTDEAIGPRETQHTHDIVCQCSTHIYHT